MNLRRAHRTSLLFFLFIAPAVHAGDAPAALELPGTQPETLLNPLLPASDCAACHGHYDEAQEPYTRWAASLMGQASRDPVFRAALAIANQDVPGAGTLCLRCHAPSGWAAGRAEPADGSALDQLEGDLDGVSCHVCHRMMDPRRDAERSDEDARAVAFIEAVTGRELPDTSGGGVLFLDPVDHRRGPYELEPDFPYHAWRQSDFHRDAALCGSCHDVTNPLLSQSEDGSFVSDPDGGSLDSGFPLERTYTEWRLSDYAQGPVETFGRFGGDHSAVSSCQDCHMPDTTGRAGHPDLEGTERDDLGQHDFNGTNSWVLGAVRELHPDAETGLTEQSVADARARTLDLQRRAADLRAFVRGSDLVARVVNQTGHKLPTGYGEGRRMWLHVRFLDAAGNVLVEHGAYDRGRAALDARDTTVFEAVHARDDGPSFHFLLNSRVEKDNRIPPRGYRREAFAEGGAAPVGERYEEEQYWHDTAFAIPRGAVRAEVFLDHQTTTREYAEFLRDANETTPDGEVAYRAWERHGRSAPVLKAALSVDLTTPRAAEAIPYGRAKVTSAGDAPVLDYDPRARTLRVSGGRPFRTGAVVFDELPASRLVAGGSLYVDSPLGIVGFTLDANGEAEVDVAARPGTALYAQALFRDPGDPFGVGMTNGLRLDL